VLYSPGQRWTHQCMECECLHGEVDCWPLDCPPTTCSHSSLLPDTCCPSCSPCFSNSSSSNTSTSCGPQVGLLRQEGDSWSLPSAPCTSCSCKAPYCESLSSSGSLPRPWLAVYIALLLLGVLRPLLSPLLRPRPLPSPLTHHSWSALCSPPAATTPSPSTRSLGRQGAPSQGGAEGGDPSHSLLPSSKGTAAPPPRLWRPEESVTPRQPWNLPWVRCEHGGSQPSIHSQ